MRIAFFHNLRAGGAKRAMYKYAKALAARGHAIEVFTLSTADEDFLPMGEVAERVTVEPVTWQPPLQTRLLPFAIQYVNLARRLGALNALASAHARVAEAINRGGFDVAFVHHDHLTQTPHLFRHLRVPSVYYCQEPLRRYYEHPMHLPEPPRDLKGRLRALWYAPVERIFEARHKGDDAASAREADLVLANSCYSRESIRRAYGIDARVAPLGVDTALFRPTGAAEEHAVITVGRFQENKDQALVIEAVSRLPAASRPKVILVGESTGTAQYRDHLVALARDRGVELELLEHVDDRTLVEAYNRAKCAVYTPVMEPFGFVPLEAAACGKPTVGVREGGVRETVKHGETGLLADRSPEAVAEALSRLLDDELLRLTLGRQALEDVERHWSWAHSAAVLEGYMRQVMQRAPSTPDLFSHA